MGYAEPGKLCDDALLAYSKDCHGTPRCRRTSRLEFLDVLRTCLAGEQIWKGMILQCILGTNLCVAVLSQAPIECR